jgi:hypothetical protein
MSFLEALPDIASMGGAVIIDMEKRGVKKFL